eukprot:1184257-Alexandrium_andersonii.AAC.1
MAGCGLRRIAALTGLERTVVGTSDPLRCKDPSLRPVTGPARSSQPLRLPVPATHSVAQCETA